jgi:orotate phosphoribosyltransferase
MIFLSSLLLVKFNCRSGSSDPSTFSVLVRMMNRWLKKTLYLWVMEKYAVKVAQYLLQSKAIKLEPANPFTWASGWKSPIYCDNRVTLSYPEIRTYLRDQFVSLIKRKYQAAEVIAGVATGGIPQGVLVAGVLELPFIYVRSAPKGHGLENLIEGLVQPGKKVVVIEDLISTGGSSLKAVDALRESGFIVEGMVAIFTYGFQLAMDNFLASSCSLFALSNYDVLIEEALRTGYIRDSELSRLKEWRRDPAAWKP